MEREPAAESQPSPAAERLLDVLELLVNTPRGMALSDVASRLGLAKSATHRLLSGLVRRGYAQHASGRDAYRASMKITALGFRLAAQTDLLDICQPILDKLAAETGELVLMTLFEGDALTFVAKAQGDRRGLRYDTDLGWAVALHATATGRAWLMTLADDDAVARVEGRGYAVPERYGRQKVKSSADLITELALTRRRGYALSIDEGENGSAAVAMPIPNKTTTLSPGTITVAGTIARITCAVEKIIPDLSTATAEIGALCPIMERRNSHFFT